MKPSAPPAPSAHGLWLVRHPKPVGVEGLCYGRLDVAVDPDGVERVASTLAARLPAGIALRSSPATRCRALADALLACRPDLRWLGISPWLAEMDLGDWEGRRWSDIPESALRAWTDDFADYRAGGTGESVRVFLARVAQGLAATRGKRVPGGEQCQGKEGEVWITHAGVMRAIHWLRQAAPGQMPLAGQWPAMAVGYGELWCVGAGDDARETGRELMEPERERECMTRSGDGI